jgi:hypothetical protein
LPSILKAPALQNKTDKQTKNKHKYNNKPQKMEMEMREKIEKEIKF